MFVPVKLTQFLSTLSALSECVLLLYDFPGSELKFLYTQWLAIKVSIFLLLNFAIADYISRTSALSVGDHFLLSEQPYRITCILLAIFEACTTIDLAISDTYLQSTQNCKSWQQWLHWARELGSYK